MPPISIGDVFAITFQNIDHDKYCIITGKTELGTFIYSVFINTGIDYISREKPHLLPFQIKILQNDNRFLSHDSYVGCDHYEIFSEQQLQNLHNNGSCRFLGTVNANDLVLVRETIINGGLLSPEELQYYFQIPIEE